jgi:energy-coupling factor transporter ATP-binding protein EcfA2
MKLYLSYAAFYNRAPFEKLEMHFEENEIAVLTAVNGRGKTTVLSHIVDAFHEMARPFFQGEYEGKENKFYRVSSQTENLNSNKFSLAYLRFRLKSGEKIDYVNARGELTEEEYNNLGLPDDKIQFNELKVSLDLSGFAKNISSSFEQKKAQLIFESNIFTYFPSYRYEAPGYLNDPYQIELSFAKRSGYTGLLRNPIEVVSGLPQIANWIMDVVLDARVSDDHQSLGLFYNLNILLTSTLISKGFGPLRFGIGPRGFGGTRIQIVTDQVDSKSVYPSIFNISAGEASMLCLFGELIRQSDNINKNVPFADISGIILIDEVDKHLHIKLQKEILPRLLNKFPNIQFIISSHSPFLSMGLAEVALDRSKIIDLETFGISKDPTTNELYAEVYQMMIGENSRFKELYISLEAKIKTGNEPLIITEGKTDVQHLRTAKNRLSIQDLDVEFFDITEDWGDSRLKILLKELSKIPHTRKIVGIFDRDDKDIVKDIEKDGRTYKSYGNNVFAFCIPIPLRRQRYSNISIEFFYLDSDLKKEKDGKRLYFNNEVAFIQSAARKNERTLIRLDEAKSSDEDTKKIFDENIGTNDWIHSKSIFSNLVENDADFTNGFDFSDFQLIFAKIREILT